MISLLGVLSFQSLRNSYDYALSRHYMQVARAVDEQLSVNETVDKLLAQRLEIDSVNTVIQLKANTDSSDRYKAEQSLSLYDQDKLCLKKRKVELHTGVLL